MIGDQAAPLPPNTKIVSFSKNAKGEFVDHKGVPVDKQLILSTYQINKQGEVVDHRGQPVQSINVMIEEQPVEDDLGEEVSSYEDIQIEVDPPEESSDGASDVTLPCGEHIAEDIALGKAVERAFKKVGYAEPDIEHIWQVFLTLAEEEKWSQGFELLLRAGDDIYLLRGCALAGGTVLRKMHKRVGARLIKRLCQIVLGGQIEILGLNFMERGIKLNLLDRLSPQGNLDCLDALQTVGAHFNLAVRDRATYLHSLASHLIDLQ